MVKFSIKKHGDGLFAVLVFLPAEAAWFSVNGHTEYKNLCDAVAAARGMMGRELVGYKL